MSEPLTPAAALERIAFLLERSLAPRYRVQAFRRAAKIIRDLPTEELAKRAEQKTLRKLPGIGEATEAVVLDALAGNVPDYLRKLEAEAELEPEPTGGAELLAALRGDCHTHSEWSDGTTPIIEMASAARELGREYIVLTDHSPRLTIANGLTAERLRAQLEEVAEINSRFDDFRILTGIEVDILEDGALDQDPELLDQLDVVVASVHSKLRMDSKPMTERMLAAIKNPRTNILGHCTGRLLSGKGRPPSEFDADAIFNACADNNVAVEINSRPERKDPPSKLLAQATKIGCLFSIDTDAHAPGQLTWLSIGCERAMSCDITADKVVNARSADELVSWARQ